jgi:hypothetical protein
MTDNQLFVLDTLSHLPLLIKGLPYNLTMIFYRNIYSCIIDGNEQKGAIIHHFYIFCSAYNTNITIF